MDRASRRRPFYSKWVWKDWDADTRDLDPYEYTAYHRLLGFAANTSPDLCSIPDDDRRLARAVGFGPKRWLSVRSRVLDFFILRGDGRYEHARLRRDVDVWLQHCANQRSRRTGGAHPVQPDGDHTRSREKLEIESDSRHSQESVSLPPTISPPSSPSPNGRRPSGARPEREHPGFPRFYEHYPRRDARRAASKAFDSALKRHGDLSESDLAWAAERFSAEIQRTGTERRFVPMPATWLNQDRFLEFFEDHDDEQEG